MIGEKYLHPVDSQRLADIARVMGIQRRSGHLPEGERTGLREVIRVLLLRHGGNADRTEAVATYLLAHASEAQTPVAPTIEALRKIAASPANSNEVG